MKKTISILLFLFIVIFTQAQTSKDEAFVELNKLLAKAKGQKYTDDVVGGSQTVSEQLFSEAIIITRYKTKKYEMVSRFQKMNWPELMDYYFYDVYDNEKLKTLRLKFKEDVDWDVYISKNEGGKINKFPEVDVYVLEKDKAEVERLINVIGLHFSKLR